ncbi:hypothetical protein B0H14DRAFT_2384420 [Mycena olivaceomarginata]|nr:hypothetical protein B0H14DRAFT_2384420 [Mycena olivaceomarginata]
MNLGTCNTPSPVQKPYKHTKPSLDTHEKLDKVLDLHDELDWTLGDFLFHMFAHRDDDHQPLHRSKRQDINSQASEILEAWLTSPDGRGYNDQLMYDTETPYLSIRPVRHPLTAFATQISGDYLEVEASRTVQPSGGLRASLTVQPALGASSNSPSIQWADLGSSIPTATRILKTNQRVAWSFLHRIAEPKPRSRNGVVCIRKSRPRENVSWMISAAFIFNLNHG